MNELKHKYNVVAFRAVDEPKLCNEYVKGHIKVLTDFGIDNITSNNETWTKNPNIYCLGLFNESVELLGGIRIQLANGINPLPIEDAIGYIDKRVCLLVENYALNGGIGELSGLWIDNRLRGLGMGWYMVRAAIASSSQLNFKTMIGICGDVTLNMFTSVGFVVDKSLGENGNFLYPNDELIAHVVGILNAITLESATKYDKEIMVSLRKNSLQKRIECDTGIKVEINYQLNYPNTTEVNYKKGAQILSLT